MFMSDGHITQVHFGRTCKACWTVIGKCYLEEVKSASQLVSTKMASSVYVICSNSCTMYGFTILCIQLLETLSTGSVGTHHMQQTR